MATIKLSEEEKEIINQGVLEFTKIMQRFQECNTYKSFVNMQNIIEAKLDKSKILNEMGDLGEKINNTLNL